jgi:hypothetical protein
VIYVVRDPRDVAVSAYYYDRKGKNIKDEFPLETYITTKFMKTDEYFGTWGEHAGSWLVNPRNILKISRLKRDYLGTMGSWGENVTSWLGARGHDREFLLVRYEDLLENTQREMTRISEFLDLRVSAEQVSKAIELSSAENMRKLEVAQSDQWVTTKESRKDIPFVRAAKSGQWQQVLPSASVREIESAWGPVMQLLRYPLSSELQGSTQTVERF